MGLSFNALLALFGQQMIIQGQNTSNLTSDFFVEENAINLGIDELLDVRIAQACGRPRPKLGYGGRTNFQSASLAHRAAEVLREDLDRIYPGVWRYCPTPSIFTDARGRNWLRDD